MSTGRSGLNTYKMTISSQYSVGLQHFPWYVCCGHSGRISVGYYQFHFAI